MDPPCGFSSSPSWSNCPYGDNQRRQRTFVRYVYDQDGDGFPVGWDFDDVDEDISDDVDGDGLVWYMDCDDTNSDIGLDCDNDGFLPEEDCDDNDPLLGGDFEDCDGDGILIERIVMMVIIQ